MASSNALAVGRFGSDMNSGDVYSGSYFEPDIMLPEQFNARDEDGVDGGERKLMAAILSDGIEAFLDQANQYVKGNPSRLDALDWVDSKDSTYVFSFDNVCQALGINPEYLRLGLTRYVASVKNAKKNNLAPQITPWKKIRRPRGR